MKRKIKITEQQLNYIVENIVRKSKVNHKTSKAKYLKSLKQLNEETIDEEILDEGVKEWVAIALMLFPSLSKAGAVEATKALNQSPMGKEMIKQAKEDIDKGDTYSMAQDTSKPIRGYDVSGVETQSGKVLNTLQKANQLDVLFSQNGLLKKFIPEHILPNYGDKYKDVIDDYKSDPKSFSWKNHLSVLQKVLKDMAEGKNNVITTETGEEAIRFFRAEFGEDVIKTFQGFFPTKYYKNLETGKTNSNEDGYLGDATLEILARTLSARMDQVDTDDSTFKKGKGSKIDIKHPENIKTQKRD